jgi:hypothetical protein
LFIFDLARNAVLLVAGDKSGHHPDDRPAVEDARQRRALQVRADYLTEMRKKAGLTQADELPVSDTKQPSPPAREPSYAPTRTVHLVKSPRQ